MRIARYVYQQVAENTIHQPWWTGFLFAIEQRKCNFQFVNSIGASLVNARRLTGWSNENAGKKIGQCRMIQPVTNQTLDQIRSSQKWAIRRSGSTQHQMIASTSAGVAAIQHELFRSQTALARLFIKSGCVVNQLPPIVRWMNVHFNHSRVWRDFDLLQARIKRGSVAFQNHRHLQFRRSLFNGPNQVYIIFGRSHRRQK